MNDSNAVIGLSWLGRCFDIVSVDPLVLANSNKIGRNALQIPEIKEGEELPSGVKPPENSYYTHVVTTEELISNSYDYRSEMNVKLGVNAEFGGLFEFSASVSSSEAAEQTASREEVMKYALMVRERQRLILDLENPDKLKVHLDPAFAKAVSQLPTSVDYDAPDSDDNPYRALISVYGTHFASTLTMGGLAYQNVRISTQELSSGKTTKEEFEASAKVSLEAYGGGGITASGATDQARKDDQKRSIQRSEINFSGGKGGLELYSSWIGEVDIEPVPILSRSVLTRLPELLTNVFFPEDPDIDAKRVLLEEELDFHLITQGGMGARYFQYGKPLKFQSAQYSYSYCPSKYNELFLHTPGQKLEPGFSEVLPIFECTGPLDRKGTVVCTGEQHPVNIRITQLDYLVTVTGQDNSKKVIAANMQRPEWYIGVYTESSTAPPLRPLISGDTIFIYTWDEAQQQYYILRGAPLVSLEVTGIGRYEPSSWLKNNKMLGEYLFVVSAN